MSELVEILREPVPPLADYDGTPALPPHFLDRRDDLRRLKETVLADVLRPTVITSAKQTAALEGMGGIGKSVLAAALGRAINTRQAMEDGILWLKAGQDATRLTLLNNMKLAGTYFGDVAAHYVDEASAGVHLPCVLAKKACLIILDDVWSKEQVVPFWNALGPRCRLLVTTRDSSLVSKLEAQEHCLDVLSSEQALALLAEWSDQELTEEALHVAEECGNLPIALTLCGAMARDGTQWPDLLDMLHKADLKSIEGDLPNYSFPNVQRALCVSVEMLGEKDPAAVGRYHDLAVFQRKAVPEAAVVTLWCREKGFAERDARKLLTTLGCKAMLTVQGDSPHRCVSFHDLLYDYLQDAARDRIVTLHGDLIDAYQSKCPGGWARGPDDGYFFQNGVYHLVKARRFADAIEFLHLLYQRPGDWEKTFLDSLSKFTFIHLRDCPEDEALRIDPMKLASLLRGFYEIEPVSAAIDLLVRYHHREKWSEMVDYLLGAENFVLRYALSESLANACTLPNPPPDKGMQATAYSRQFGQLLRHLCHVRNRPGKTVELTEIITLLADKSISRRELGGYALRLVYTREPDLIDPRHLELLGESETYPGRSILGDLLLNLVFQNGFRRDLVKSERFWKPVWDFNKLDVWDLEAAEPFMAGSPLPSAVPEVREVSDAFEALRTAEEWRKTLLQRTDTTSVRDLLEGYFSLGKDTTRIRRAQKELAPRHDLYELMRLLFSHPLWSVAEAAASVLASIIEDDEDHYRLKILKELLKDPHWRVRFGACEAAFAVRHIDRCDTFFQSVHDFYNDANCRVRALCAENLVSFIINRRDREARDDLISNTFKREIRHWLCDEDCWVLEHMFRLVRELAQCNVADVEWLLSSDSSRLFKGERFWNLGREEFLVHIERRKRELVGAGV